MSDLDKKARAQHAERLLNDDVLKSAFNVVLEYHTDVLTSSSATDEQVLEARREYLALKRVKSQLSSFVLDGKIIDKRNQDRGND